MCQTTLTHPLLYYNSVMIMFLVNSKKKGMSQLYKLKITLATTNCGEGDFDKKGVLIHLPFYL